MGTRETAAKTQLRCEKLLGKDRPADLFTTYLEAATMETIARDDIGKAPLSSTTIAHDDITCNSTMLVGTTFMTTKDGVCKI